MLRWFEHQQVYHPSRSLEADGSALGRRWEDVYFATSDGFKLNGWFFPGNAGSSRSEWAMLICHGNAGNISHRLQLYSTLLETGVAVFAFDYRGYGRSQGRPSESGTYLDAQAAHAWLHARGYAANRIIALGESLGGGIASELCLRETIGGLILISTFTSIGDLGAELYPWLPIRWINQIGYDTVSKLPKLTVPVLVMHGRHDELIRFHHAETNFAAANDPKMFCEIGGRHGDPLADRTAFLRGIEDFLRNLKSPAR